MSSSSARKPPRQLTATVRHRSFDAGKLQEIKGDVITVAFPEFGTKKMVLSALVEHGMIEM